MSERISVRNKVRKRAASDLFQSVFHVPWCHTLCPISVRCVISGSLAGKLVRKLLKDLIKVAITATSLLNECQLVAFVIFE